jgi:hypothetical protein
MAPGASSTPTVLVPTPDSGIMYFPTIAPDASATLYWDSAANALQLYSIASGTPTLAASIQLSTPRPDGISFVSNDELVVKTGDTLTFYSARDGAKEREVTIIAQ